MNEKELAEIKARAEAATPGPWRRYNWDHVSNGDEVVCDTRPENNFPNEFAENATRQRSARPHNGFTKNHGQGETKSRRKMAAKSRKINRGKKMNATNDVWAIAELMGHLTLAGRVTKPGEYGGLWQIDVPEGDSFRTEFFGSQSVYRIRIVSEEIARAYARTEAKVIEYNAPIITREEHLAYVHRAEGINDRLEMKVRELERRLTAVNALPERTTFIDELISEDEQNGF